MNLVEVPYADAIEAEKNRFIEEVAKTFQSARAIQDTLFYDHVGVMARLQGVYIKTAIQLAAVEALSTVYKPKEAKEWDKFWLFLMRQWVNEYGANAARETATTTRNDIQRVISAALALDQEFNPAAVIEAILAVRSISRSRAKTIARTETHNAMMFAADAGARKVAQDNGMTMLKRWLPVTDERTRVSHASMAMLPAIPIDQDFIVGGIPMARPGDPRGGADNTINCRCVLTYEVGE